MADRLPDTTDYDEEATQVAELKAEEALLAGRADDIFLLSSVTEAISDEPDPKRVLALALEHCCILRDIWWAGACVVEASIVHLLAEYAGFREDAPPLPQLFLPDDVLRQIQRGPALVPQTMPLASALSRHLGTEGGTLLAVPFETRAYVDGMVLFQGHSGDEHLLRRSAPLLQQVVESVATRIDTLTLLEELRALNSDLDHQVAHRTRQLEETNRRLQTSEAELRSLTEGVLDSATFAVCISDATGRICWVNDSWQRLFGIERSQTIGRDVRAVLAERGPLTFFDGELVARRLAAAAASPRVIDIMECELRPQPGASAESWVEVHTYPISHGLYSGGRLEQYYDISERKRTAAVVRSMETQLAQSQKLEAIGTLASGIAHDFNNVLQVILGNTQIAKARSESADDVVEVKRRVLDGIERAAFTGANLVRGLLDFSRRESPDTEVLDLSEQARRAEALLRRTIPRMIDIHVATAEHPLWIRADPVQVEQVIVNLATNARDAMPDGGLIQIRTLRHTVGIADGRPMGLEPGPYAVLEFRDTGIGMDCKLQERIFDPFFTTKPPGQGTGLGLATVYGIVQRHGGRINCSSTPGKGASFTLYWPSSDASTTKTDPPPAPLRDFAPRAGTVLVVDDEDSVRTLVRTALEFSGYDVLTASNGEEALRVHQAACGCIDAVVMDIGMPGMGGYKCRDALRALQPDLPVVLASGYLLSNSEEGADATLAKPFQVQALLDTIKRVMRVRE